MKKSISIALAAFSFSAFAAAPELPELSKSQLEKVSNEFAVDFSHTAVAAPETDGAWGVEIGIVGGATQSPELKDLVGEAGEDGSDYKSIYHAGAMARVHFPFDLFAEVTLLPEKEISDITVKNRTFALGWNAGAFFNWPLDVAIGANFSNTDLSFDQVINNSSTGNVDVNSTIDFKSKTRVLWLGVSKTFWFFTPYAKVGTAKTESDVKVDASTGTIFDFSSSQSESVSSTGGFFVVGANVQLLILRLGVEASQTADVKRISGKLSFAF